MAFIGARHYWPSSLMDWYYTNRFDDFYACVVLPNIYTGLILLSSDELGLHTLVDALSLPSAQVSLSLSLSLSFHLTTHALSSFYLQLREIVLEGIYEMLRLPLPKSQENPFMRDLSKDTDSMGDINFTFDLPSRTRSYRHNVLNNYTAALLMSMIKAGVVEVLIELGNDGFGEEMSKAWIFFFET